MQKALKIISEIYLSSKLSEIAGETKLKMIYEQISLKRHELVPKCVIIELLEMKDNTKSPEKRKNKDKDNNDKEISIKELTDNNSNSLNLGIVNHNN